MKEFIEYILQFGNLNQQQLSFISEKANKKELSKDEHFWEEGKAVTHVGFLFRGVFRVYYYDNKGDEHTRYFIEENHLISDGLDNGINYTPSEYLQAVTDCKLVVFSKKTGKKFRIPLLAGMASFKK